MRKAQGGCCSCGMRRQVDPSGVIGVKTSSGGAEAFEGREDVRLKDVVSLEEAAIMGCGIMELKDSTASVDL